MLVPLPLMQVVAEAVTVAVALLLQQVVDEAEVVCVDVAKSVTDALEEMLQRELREGESVEVEFELKEYVLKAELDCVVVGVVDAVCA